VLDTSTCSLVGGPGDDVSGVDPQLAWLFDNGGATLTHAPLPASPLVDAGLELMRKLQPLFMAMEGGKYVQSVKYGCELAGVPCGAPRPPLRPLTDEEKREFRALYAAAVG